MKNEFKIRARVWIYGGGAMHSENAAAMQGAWHFITIPERTSGEIKKRFGALARGWGSLRVVAKIGRASWQTSIFPDRRAGVYLLPVKKSVRKEAGLVSGDTASLSFEILTLKPRRSKKSKGRKKKK
jgi:hypothetical protein